MSFLFEFLTSADINIIEEYDNQALKRNETVLNQVLLTISCWTN